jgi:hypothetical protein
MFGFFNKKKEVEEDWSLHVDFIVRKNGNIEVDTKWSEYTEATAENMGKLLFAINNGNFQDNIAMMLKESADNNIEQRPFIAAIIAKWGELVKLADELEDEDDDDYDVPVVSPDEYFGGPKKGKGDE